MIHTIFCLLKALLILVLVPVFTEILDINKEKIRMLKKISGMSFSIKGQD